jgi:uncharacterized protein (TIGR02145 family)
MKKRLFSLLVAVALLIGSQSFAQTGVAINNTGADAVGSAMLDVSSTSKGFLPPRMTSAQRNAISSPVEGLVIYNTDEKVLNVYNGTSWDYANPFVCGQPFSDPRDGKVYNTLLLGTQCWMKENLNVGTMVNSPYSLVEQSDNGIPEKYCFNNDPANCATYGGLYQWNEMMQYSTTPGVQGICPTGWHLPTDDDWTTLTTYVSSQPAYLCGYNTIAKALASTTLWIASGNACAVGNDLAANNATGFAALPGGWRDGGAWMALPAQGTWWSSSSLAGYRFISIWHHTGSVDMVSVMIYSSSSVRCLKTY